MISKSLARAALWSILLAPLWVSAEAGGALGKPAAAAPAATEPPATAASTTPAQPGDCLATPCDAQPRHITIATPAPASAAWPLPDRIAWVAKVLLAVLGYIGVLMGISLLRKIERQTRASEEAAQAAASSAEAALEQAKALVRAERPWVLVTVEPARSQENAFALVATNRGRSPARIASVVNMTTTAAGEEQLPAEPVYGPEDPGVHAAGLILLPGESTRIRIFRRDEVREFCGGAEKFQQVVDWQEKIFLYGQIEYADLIAPQGEQRHASAWCCWYIHGRQKSGMVMAGPPAYHRHS